MSSASHPPFIFICGCPRPGVRQQLPGVVSELGPSSEGDAHPMPCFYTRLVYRLRLIIYAKRRLRCVIVYTSLVRRRRLTIAQRIAETMLAVRGVEIRLRIRSGPVEYTTEETD